jgi:lysozyme family protein
MRENFQSSLAIILREEGGNDDDPRDHGGRTSRGIIQREWDTYRKTHTGRPADVWKAPQNDINAIYRDKYWNPYCDDLPAGIDLLFFNASVNSGRQPAVKELQRALGVQVDGMMGMVTINAATNYPDPQLLIHKVSDCRRAYYRALKQFSIYGRGWMARTDRVEAAAKEMAPTSTASSTESETMPLSAKAPPEDDMALVQTASIDPPPPAGGMMANVGIADVVSTAAVIQQQVKPIVKSKISWGAVGLGGTGIATTVANAPPTIAQQFIDVMRSPIFWIILVQLGLVGWILYHYWRDHGKGAVQ